MSRRPMRQGPMHQGPMRQSPMRQAWLEERWIAPAYSGGLLASLAIFFFIAATTTLAGWLYVISGILLALLVIAAILVRQNLQHLTLERLDSPPVPAGQDLTLQIQVKNRSSQPKSLLQLCDRLPRGLGDPIPFVLVTLAPGATYTWIQYRPTHQRGIYRWQAVTMRTGAPLGLFWKTKRYPLPATAIVHPPVLRLDRCPVIDRLGQEQSLQLMHNRQTQSATEGMTRSLRPYRWGDATRLIHWRTSARYGELRVRELETFTSGRSLTLCLDSARAWQPEDFEQAVIAAASLYFYGVRQGLSIQLWTASTGVVRGDRSVLDALAATNPNELLQTEELPNDNLLWLTQAPDSLANLPPDSYWLLWQANHVASVSQAPGIIMQGDQPLLPQLQAPIG
ncbi:MAG: DUF58 domain-containing protein [Synechococcales bacterium]|nr:DUF58 domain-containing protein [Synechococcales bacterium]